MTNEKKIIIPNLELLDDEQYDEVIQMVESLPVDYEIWEKEN